MVMLSIRRISWGLFLSLAVPDAESFVSICRCGGTTRPRCTRHDRPSLEVGKRSYSSRLALISLGNSKRSEWRSISMIARPRSTRWRWAWELFSTGAFEQSVDAGQGSGSIQDLVSDEEKQALLDELKMIEESGSGNLRSRLSNPKSEDIDDLEYGQLERDDGVEQQTGGGYKDEKVEYEESERDGDGDGDIGVEVFGNDVQEEGGEEEEYEDRDEFNGYGDDEPYRDEKEIYEDDPHPQFEAEAVHDGVEKTSLDLSALFALGDLMDAVQDLDSPQSVPPEIRAVDESFGVVDGGRRHMSHWSFSVDNSITMGDVDPEKKAAIEPALRVLGNIANLIDTTDDIFSFKYFGQVRHRRGIEAWMKQLILEAYPAAKDVKMLTNRKRDKRDS